METLFLPILIGTSREARESIHVAKFVYTVLQQRSNVETELIDPQNLNLPLDGNDDDLFDPRYKELTAKADGFVIILPEYNHGYPGSLKRMLDSEFANYRHKPVSLMGVSSGQWGGVRAIENILGPLRKMGLVAISKDVQFPQVQDLFDVDGNIQDPDSFTRRVDRAIDELVWMATALKTARRSSTT